MRRSTDAASPVQLAGGEPAWDANASQVIQAGQVGDAGVASGPSTTELTSPQASELRYVPTLPEDEGMPDNQTEDDLPLSAVIDSVYRTYPLLEAAIRQRDVAAGEQLQAAGAFDLKLSAGSENQPLGFYETYRQNIKLLQPLYSGGEAFAAYRVGRGGVYEPWYLERQTNDGGEFKAGLSLPFSRNRVIDDRRANVWKTTYGRQQVEFEIQAELIDFVQQAGYAYWDWVAAGERYRIATSILELARERNQGIERQVELGDKDPPVLQDNRRLIVSREAKQIEAGRKLQETAVKLSIYYRDELGRPVIPAPEQLPEFPNPTSFNASQLDTDVQQAVERRPELRVLSLLQRQLEVDYAQAHNDFRPALDGFVTGAQDMGAPTSKKMDKSQFELETGVLMEVSAQRRK
ncbi:MAG: TolC family protein, partial [Planctomycetaceae bacterium]